MPVPVGFIGADPYIEANLRKQLLAMELAGRGGGGGGHTTSGPSESDLWAEQQKKKELIKLLAEEEEKAKEAQAFRESREGYDPTKDLQRMKLEYLKSPQTDEYTKQKALTGSAPEFWQLPPEQQAKVIAGTKAQTPFGMYAPEELLGQARQQATLTETSAPWDVDYKRAGAEELRKRSEIDALKAMLGGGAEAENPAHKDIYKTFQKAAESYGSLLGAPQGQDVALTIQYKEAKNLANMALSGASSIGPGAYTDNMLASAGYALLHVATTSLSPEVQTKAATDWGQVMSSLGENNPSLAVSEFSKMLGAVPKDSGAQRSATNAYAQFLDDYLPQVMAIPTDKAKSKAAYLQQIDGSIKYLKSRNPEAWEFINSRLNAYLKNYGGWDSYLKSQGGRR